MFGEPGRGKTVAVRLVLNEVPAGWKVTWVPVPVPVRLSAVLLAVGVIVAQAVDALGAGLFLAFAVVCFRTAEGIALVTVGLVLSAAALFSLPAGPLAGPVTDRIGPRRLAVASNLVRVPAFTGSVFTDAPWQLVALVTVTPWGESQFRPAAAALVAQAAGEGQRARWYAMERALRNGGIGAGGLLGSALVSWGGTGGYAAVVVLNAVSFLVAAALVGTWRRFAGPDAGGARTGGAARRVPGGARRPGVPRCPGHRRRVRAVRPRADRAAERLRHRRARAARMAAGHAVRDQHRAGGAGADPGGQGGRAAPQAPAAAPGGLTAPRRRLLGPV
ncbi:MFS transporter [Streptomyces sp. NPDC006854]|uniref:MFS transporter n=1 Tax=Streptomyces sp. NPDC006854 TaxID=3155115 RepID=UPI0033E53276